MRMQKERRFPPERSNLYAKALLNAPTKKADRNVEERHSSQVDGSAELVAVVVPAATLRQNVA